MCLKVSGEQVPSSDYNIAKSIVYQSAEVRSFAGSLI